MKDKVDETKSCKETSDDKGIEKCGLNEEIGHKMKVLKFLNKHFVHLQKMKSLYNFAVIRFD